MGGSQAGFAESQVGLHPIAGTSPSVQFNRRDSNAEKATNMSEPRQSQVPTEEKIATFAYLIWENEGKPENMDKVHWEQAEVQLASSNTHNLGMMA